MAQAVGNELPSIAAQTSAGQRVESQSIIYGAIVFLALVFADLGVSGIAAISGPMAALLLQFESLRKRKATGCANGE